MNMSVRNSLMTTTAMYVAAVAIMCAGWASPSSAQDASALANADKNGKDWLSYHGSYLSWHYSPLGQINTDNIGKLKLAFIHQVGHSTRGVQSMPLAKDGVVYYSASYDKVFALKGDTGELLW
jgi:alcohol dehydrogenase (cytochrome c)